MGRKGVSTERIMEALSKTRLKYVEEAPRLKTTYGQFRQIVVRCSLCGTERTYTASMLMKNAPYSCGCDRRWKKTRERDEQLGTIAIPDGDVMRMKSALIELRESTDILNKLLTELRTACTVTAEYLQVYDTEVMPHLIREAREKAKNAWQRLSGKVNSMDKEIRQLRIVNNNGQREGITSANYRSYVEKPEDVM